jgi:arsenical pump membrane protein
MLIFKGMLAAVAVGAVARRPGSSAAAAVAGAAAVADAALLGADGRPALALVAPLLAFLAAALTLAAVAVESGLAARAAARLAALAAGRTTRLYWLVCLVCALLTATVSLDVSIPLMVPVALVLAETPGISLAPLYLGIVAVANAASMAVAQGNPTNLVVIQHLGLSPLGFTERMFAPGLVATSVCAVAVALSERSSLRRGFEAPRREPERLCRAERSAALSIGLAGLAAWAAPLAGVAPWWPFAAVAAAFVALTRVPTSLVVVPWRIGAQVAALTVVVGALGVRLSAGTGTGLSGVVGTALAVGALAAAVNNLPASASAAALLAGPTAYAASIGLALGPLATPHGSVATLVAADLGGEAAPAIPLSRFAPLAAGAVCSAAIVLWAGG